MPAYIVRASFLIAISLSPVWVYAQSVYRCGDTYSQTPCPGGQRVEVEDARSRQQQTQALQSTQRDLKTAQTLEKSRLKEEATYSQANRSAKASTGTESQSGKSKSGDTSHRQHSGKGKPPAYFTAKAPNDNQPTKKKASESKTSDKKD